MTESFVVVGSVAVVIVAALTAGLWRTRRQRDGLAAALVSVRQDAAADRRRRAEGDAQELYRSHAATVRALSNVMEARDSDTGRHAERVARLAIEVGRAYGVTKVGAADLTEARFGFLLHDIGKVAMPDAILFKPGALTAAERSLMSRHPVVGAEIMDGIEFLDEAAKVVRSHHERWDGSGYPDGLSGEQIPLAARVFAVADVLDALTSDRPYRTRMTLVQARRMIVEASGSHFDPRVVAAFGTLPDAVIERIGGNRR